MSTFDKGGAATAAIRLHRGLLAEGVDSNLLSLEQFKPELPNSVSFGGVSSKDRLLYKIGLKDNVFYRNQTKLDGRASTEDFSFPRTEFDITQHPQYHSADLIHFHWVARFLDYERFFRKNRKPLIWTLHDMNPFTGGCHYAGECTGFTNHCDYCPILTGAADEQAAEKNIWTKAKALDSYQVPVTIVSPSQWLMRASQQSTLFSKFLRHCIPYGLDTTVFAPRDKQAARDFLGLPHDKKVLLFVSDALGSRRKGFDLLAGALRRLRDQSDFVLCAVGEKDASQSLSEVIYTGTIRDEQTMSMAYSAADLFVIPSREDNFPNTVLEAMACGTPVMSFNRGGMPDVIQPGVNGIIVEDVSEEALAEALEHFLSGDDRFSVEKIRQFAIKRYDQAVQAKHYQQLYREILGS